MINDNATSPDLPARLSEFVAPLVAAVKSP